jgi:hypothetical protein
MGGILVATVLTIMVLPAGYALFFGREPKKSATPSKEKIQSPANDIHDRPALAAE